MAKECIYCQFETYTESDYKKHLKSIEHQDIIKLKCYMKDSLDNYDLAKNLHVPMSLKMEWLVKSNDHLKQVIKNIDKNDRVIDP